MITFNPDKFGFYESSNGRKSYSKLEAAEWGPPIRWNFNDDVYSSFDWSVEPPVDIWELYKFRARQIREAYDYVVLFYSGGSDSHNMTEAFLDADCKIDEFLTMWDYPSTKLKNTFLNAEIFKVVFPYLEELKKKGYKFEHTLIDITETAEKLLKNSFDYIYMTNFHLSILARSKLLFRDHIPHHRKMISEGKKIAYVYGKEKIHMGYQNGRHCVRFFDQIDEVSGLGAQSMYHQGWYDEFFYWTPDCPLIPIKQAHIVKRLLENVDSTGFYIKEPTPYGYNPKLNMYLMKGFFNKLLYPKWDNSTYSFGKVDFNSPFRTNPIAIIDREFVSTSNTDAKTKYLDHLKLYISTMKKHGLYERCQSKTLYSKEYYL